MNQLDFYIIDTKSSLNILVNSLESTRSKILILHISGRMVKLDTSANFECQCELYDIVHVSQYD